MKPGALTSVRARLTLWNIAGVALALAGFGAAVHFSVRFILLKTIDTDLALAARPPIEDARRILVPPPFEAEGFPPPQDAPPPPGQAGPQPPPRPPDPNGTEGQPLPVHLRGRNLSPRAFDLKGQALLPSPREMPWDVPAFRRSVAGETVTATVQAGGEPLRLISTPVFKDATPVGVVQLAYPLTETLGLLGDLDRTLLLLIPFILVLSGIGGAFLADRALRPVRRISRAAERIGAEDLSGRLPVTGGDEFAELATNFNRMFSRLEEAFGRLEAAFERQRRFTADASHELRTPLTTLKANTSLALSGPRPMEEYRRALDAADRAADTMNRIVQDLLLLAHSDSGDLVMERLPIPVEELFGRIASELREKETGIGVRTEIESPSLMVMGDPHPLTRLFRNLVDNAVRHTPPGGCITLRAGETGGEVVLQVVDTGEGIAAEHLPHLGERFYRVDKARSRAQGGVGLGLSICHSIVEAHGGSLAIESEVGRGTTVTVRLPRCEPEPDPCRNFASIPESRDMI